MKKLFTICTTFFVLFATIFLCQASGSMRMLMQSTLESNFSEMAQTPNCCNEHIIVNTNMHMMVFPSGLLDIIDLASRAAITNFWVLFTVVFTASALIFAYQYLYLVRRNIGSWRMLIPYITYFRRGILHPKIW